MKKSSSNAFGITLRSGDYLDYLRLQYALEEKHGVKTAFIYDTKSTKGYQDFQDFRPRYWDSDTEGYAKNISLIDDQFYFQYFKFEALAYDDISELGIKLNHGRLPSNIGEILIPQTYMDFILRTQEFQTSYREPNSVVYSTFTSEEDVYNHDFTNFKVVGTFDDQLEIPDKYHNISASSESDPNCGLEIIKDEEKLDRIRYEAYRLTDDYLLNNLVITCTENIDFNNIWANSNTLVTASPKLSLSVVNFIKDYAINELNIEKEDILYLYNDSPNLEETTVYANKVSNMFAMPFLILILPLQLAFILICYNQLIKGNLDEIYVLKKNNTSKLDFIKLFSIPAMIITVINLIIGICLGLGITAIIEYVLNTYLFYATHAIVPLDIFSIMICIAVTIGINTIALFTNLAQLKYKHLDKLNSISKLDIFVELK